MINKISKKIIINKEKIKLHINAKKHKNLFSKYADKTGLVYFGYVNQHSDDHHIIRGLTVSTKHVDSNFCVGSVADYNLSLVDRSDIINHSNGLIYLHNWIIMAFDLHTNKSIPHFFINANNNDDKPFDALFSTFPNMKKINLGKFESYSNEFNSRFTVFARPAKTDVIETILDAKLSMTLSAHFWPLSAEQHNNKLYVYACNEKISISLLDTMLENGLWLAGYIDSQAEKIEF